MVSGKYHVITGQVDVRMQNLYAKYCVIFPVDRNDDEERPLANSKHSFNIARYSIHPDSMSPRVPVFSLSGFCTDPVIKAVTCDFCEQQPVVRCDDDADVPLVAASLNRSVLKFRKACAVTVVINTQY